MYTSYWVGHLKSNQKQGIVLLKVDIIEAEHRRLINWNHFSKHVSFLKGFAIVAVRRLGRTTAHRL